MVGQTPPSVASLLGSSRAVSPATRVRVVCQGMNTRRTTTGISGARGLVAAISTSAVLLAACGDDDAEPLTKADFIEQADAICAQTQAEAAPVFEAIWSELDEVDFDDPANQGIIFERWATATDQLIPLYQAQLDEIDQLEPPSEDRDFVETIIADQRVAMDEFDTLVDEARDGSEAARQQMESEDPFVEIDRQLREYGLVVCGADD